MEIIRAIPQGGNSWSIFIDDEFVDNVENTCSSYDAVEDYLISIDADIDNYIVFETA